MSNNMDNWRQTKNETTYNEGHCSLSLFLPLRFKFFNGLFQVDLG